MFSRIARWFILAVGAPTLFSVSCSADVRDALLNGAMDYLSGTTTQVLSSYLPFPGNA